MEEKRANPYTLEGDGDGIRYQTIRMHKLINTNEFVMLYRSHRGPLWMSQPFEFNSSLNAAFFFIHSGLCSFSFLSLGLRNNIHKATGHLGKVMFGSSTVISSIYSKSLWPSVSVLKKRLCHSAVLRLTVETHGGFLIT